MPCTVENTRAWLTRGLPLVDPQEEEREMKYRRYYQRVLKDRLTTLRKVCRRYYCASERRRLIGFVKGWQRRLCCV